MAESRRQRCIAPGSVSELDLMAWARGEAGADVQEHISRCARCREEAEAYARADARLVGAFFRRSCPPSMTLGEYALGLLEPEQAIAVAEHLLECPNCAEERRRFAAFLSEPDEPPQPEGAVARLLRRLFAQPVTNLAPAMALRGDEDETSRSYSADGYELTVSVQSATAGPSRVIAGLLLADEPPAEGASVRLYSGERLVQSTLLDDLGNFLLEGVAAGEYRLEVNLPDAVIVVDPLRVT
jgi:anti-sigma factor RsiW